MFLFFLFQEKKYWQYVSEKKKTKRDGNYNYNLLTMESKSKP